MKLPSKELLSEVLGIDVAKIIDNTHERTISVYERDFKYPCTYNASAYITINIYELAHKCKEWANNKGYVIFSSVQLTGLSVFIQTDQDEIIASFEGIEQEAIFKACEWIMEQTK